MNHAGPRNQIRGLALHRHRRLHGPESAARRARLHRGAAHSQWALRAARAGGPHVRILQNMGDGSNAEVCKDRVILARLREVPGRACGPPVVGWRHPPSSRRRFGFPPGLHECAGDFSGGSSGGASGMAGAQFQKREEFCELDQSFGLTPFRSGEGEARILAVEQLAQPSLHAGRQLEARQARGHRRDGYGGRREKSRGNPCSAESPRPAHAAAAALTLARPLCRRAHPQRGFAPGRQSRQAGGHDGRTVAPARVRRARSTL